jgi:hypothetical protein
LAPTRVVAVRAALLALVLLGGGACFRPSILSGGFKCGGPKSNQCPDNFVCDQSGFCVTTLDGGVGGAGGAAGSGGMMATGGHGGMGGAQVVCLPPVADTNCSGPVDAGGMCDPVCNTGCGSCNEKCSVNSQKTETCNPLFNAGGSTPSLFGTCQARNVGTASQSDNCAAGQVCLQLTTCNFECYQFCRSDADCSGSTCTRDLGNGRLGCEVPPADNCDPVKLKTGASDGCPGGNLSSCYLSGTTEHTVCDCQNNGTSGSVSSPCTQSRDCFPGLVCADEGRGAQCYQVCRLPGDGGVDLTRADAGEQECTTTCIPFPLTNGTNSATYGVCVH